MVKTLPWRCPLHARLAHQSINRSRIYCGLFERSGKYASQQITVNLARCLTRKQSYPVARGARPASIVIDELDPSGFEREANTTRRPRARGDPDFWHRSPLFEHGWHRRFVSFGKFVGQFGERRPIFCKPQPEGLVLRPHRQGGQLAAFVSLPAPLIQARHDATALGRTGGLACHSGILLAGRRPLAASWTLTPGRGPLRRTYRRSVHRTERLSWGA